MIPQSTASADQIINVVQSMAQYQAKEMTSSLRQKLEDVTAIHNGQIPLHGRLIAQWLHYAFPHECPYPHLDDAIEPITPMKYEQTFGADATTADDDEVKKFLEAESARVSPLPDAGDSMWNP